MANYIEIKNANTNNLNNISLNIPKHEITVVTGVSGSGKSSLVFNTLAAESQRLLNDTYSSYIQQLLPHYAQPNVESIKNLPVSIVIDQKKIGGNARSTVGTITDIYTSLRLLFSRIAEPFIGYSMIYSFNNPQGMCPTCKGIGETNTINIEKLLDLNKSLNEGAIDFPSFHPGEWRLRRYVESGNFDNDKKLKDYTEKELNRLLYDEGSKPDHPTDQWPKTADYIGVVPRITKNYIEKEEKRHVKEISRVIEKSTCPDCHGTRVNETVRSAKINGQSIADCVEMNVLDLLDFIQAIDATNVQIILDDLIKKLKSLQTVGLSYLFLNRPTTTLSGGESQRIKITKHLNSALSDVMYIFDEPSVGLHPQDILGMNAIIEDLRDKGNTVVLVDHDPDIIKIADHIIDIGPGAGVHGGKVMFEGTYPELLASDTLTGKALNLPHHINTSKPNFTDYYHLDNVSLHNVKDASIKIPKQALTLITGVAGSGKSTLIRHLFTKKYPEAQILDQSPIRGSNRSNVLTYLDMFDEIRAIFAKASGQSKSLFSYNGQGGCPVCKGRGYIKLDLAFMGDVEQVCEKCQGKCYNDEALSYTWNGLNIYELLQITVEEAADLLDQPIIKNLIDVNLGYVKLGQSLDTFSGGELQRVKIAKILDNQASNLLILDEPSTGLHEADVQKLITLLNNLIKKQKTLIVLEHNLQLISRAQWIIDMGLGGGSLGGKVLFQGYPIDLLNNHESYTAEHLRKYVK